MTQRIERLEKMASDLIGDGKSPNLFFVTQGGNVILVTQRKDFAVSAWEAIATLREESAVEDRKTGVLYSVEPESDEPGARLVKYGPR